MKVIRTVRTLIEEDVSLPHLKPKLALGDWVEIYCGHNEGHQFRIADLRYNGDLIRFEYLYDHPLMGGWHGENCLTRA